MKRAANLLFLLVFLAALAVVPLGTLLQKQSGVSFWENRALAALPELTVEAAGADDFFNTLENFYSDHIFWRDGFMTAHTWLDLRLGRPVVNDQVVAGDTLLNFHGHSRWNISYQTAQAQAAAQSYVPLREQVASYGGYFCYLGVPQQYSYFAQRYPGYLDDREWNIVPARQAFSAAMAEADIPFLDMYAVYAAQGLPGEYYSTVDHHYTLPGALVAYETLMEHLNTATPWQLRVYRPGDGLTLEALPNCYVGSKSRELYGLWPTEEKAVLAYPTDPVPFTRTDNGSEAAASVYSLPASEDDLVLYSVYMGGDIAETVIRTGRPELPSALLVGESFTNAMETVLWCSFDETRSLDLRSYTLQSLQDYIAAYQPDVVIFLRDELTYLTPLS